MASGEEVGEVRSNEGLIQQPLMARKETQRRHVYRVGSGEPWLSVGGGGGFMMS